MNLKSRGGQGLVRPGAECPARGGAEASHPPGAAHLGEARGARGGWGGMGWGGVG